MAQPLAGCPHGAGRHAVPRPRSRVVLWDYVGRAPGVFDCPAERVAVYADGISASDAALGGFALDGSQDWHRLYGFPSPYEVWNASGLGVAGAHRIPCPGLCTRDSRVSTMPFGRPRNQGYYEGLHQTTEMASPANLIWFGDGGSGTALWSDDNWWIKDIVAGAEDEAGFNRLLQDEYACAATKERPTTCSRTVTPAPITPTT